ncbi:ABC transporter substrate-binding protein [Qaidamihabitans albus]|uniref:ABC transporter substrate-binding protein n=1 Tax=Qaidamihabitans albus TaxID=2795733 RepID=UPI0018F23F4D|nr:ABC transporter substrate-binding protein [Qaidamihabitans albus]
MRFTRRRLLQLTGAAGAVVTVQACGGSLGGGSSPETSVKVGLLVPQAGVYAPLGTDMRRAWDLWLESHDGKLGDYTVETVVADEGETPQTGVPAAQRLLQSDQCDVIVGIVNSATALGVRDIVHEAKKILIVANAGAEDITAKASSPYIWRSSFTNGQVAAGMGRHLAENGPKDGVFVIASDYAAGAEAIAGFTSAFEAGGGTIAGRADPPFGTTQDYQPFLSRIRNSGAKATFCFFAGAEAVSFVKQYRQFGLAPDVPLYGSGFLTEGGVLDAQGEAALGVHTSLHYTSELDSSHNKEFVQSYQDAYDAVPTVYSVQTWDAANVLDRALRGADGLDGDTLSTALGGLGPIDDSPRGTWSFENQTPKQKFYLRKVEKRGDRYVNAVVTETGAIGQPG